MNKIKDSFLIQDLEILSGIKAHTIRIWEKRYGLLEPQRLNRNIRKYGLMDLQKLLNISFLYKNGFKISKLAKFSLQELQQKAREISLESIETNYQFNSLILAMYSFDSESFDKVYSETSEKMSFEQIFIQLFVPLLDYIGVMWQTDAIKPAHEHFISNLIVGKIILNTSKIDAPRTDTNKTYVLFLPEGEQHSLGLLFLNYYLKKIGEKTVFLGGGIPLSNLDVVQEKFEEIVWICSFVIDKTVDEKEQFVKDFNFFLKNNNSESLIVGNIWGDIKESVDLDRIMFYSSIKDLPFFE